MLDDRIRWVLRNARLHATEPQLRTASGFAGGGGRAPAVHRAQVGRWEGGGAEVTHDLVRRYEVVLGLPRGQLLCAIDYLVREERPVRATPALLPRSAPDHDATLGLLELALSPERMTGLDWDALSSNLGRMPQALVREADWEALLRRAILEMTVTGGLEFALRDEALARLAGHPRSGRVVLRMAREILQDPGTAVYSDAAHLLRYSSHPEVIPFLLEHLRTPTNNDSLRAAFFTLTMIALGRRLDAGATVAAARLALSHIRDDALPFYVHRAAAHLLRVLGLPERRRLAAVLTADDRRHVASILLEGRSLAREAVTALRRRLITTLEDSLGPVDQRDTVLQELLEAIVGTTEEPSRTSALAVLMISPQRHPVGAAYAAELRRALEWGNDVVVVECLSVLTWLVEPESLEDLTAVVLDPTSPPEQAMLCAIGVGNCPEPESTAREDRELALEVRAHALVSDPAPGVDAEDVRQRLRGLAYALGIRGRFDALTRLAGAVHPQHPHAQVCRGVLAWWLDLPEHVRPRAAAELVGGRQSPGKELAKDV